jgi:hypothetical protein
VLDSLMRVVLVILACGRLLDARLFGVGFIDDRGLAAILWHEGFVYRCVAWEGSPMCTRDAFVGVAARR